MKLLSNIFHQSLSFKLFKYNFYLAILLCYQIFMLDLLFFIVTIRFYILWNYQSNSQQLNILYSISKRWFLSAMIISQILQSLEFNDNW